MLLLDDRSSPFGTVQPESLVGGNIVLERTLPIYGTARRRLYVTKVRGSDFREGYHDYEIIQGGVVVHPRLVAAEHHDMFERVEVTSGVASAGRDARRGPLVRLNDACCSARPGWASRRSPCSSRSTP